MEIEVTAVNSRALWLTHHTYCKQGSFHEKLEQLGLPQWPVVKTAPSSAGQGLISRGVGWGGQEIRSHMPRGVAKKGKTLVHQAKDCDIHFQYMDYKQFFTLYLGPRELNFQGQSDAF